MNTEHARAIMALIVAVVDESNRYPRVGPEATQAKREARVNAAQQKLLSLCEEEK